jgi:hypothetical protein
MKIAPPPTHVEEFNYIWHKWLYDMFEWSTSVAAATVPSMTTTQRDALAGVNGMIIYNTTTTFFNFYENGAWVTK